MALNLVDRVIGGSYGKRRFQRAYRRLHQVALTGLNYGYPDAALNGEYALIDRLAEKWGGRPVVALDVGAASGAWTRAVLQRVPAATVYAFEPVESSFAQLAANLDGVAHVHRCALGAAVGSAEMFAPTTADGFVGEHASLYKRDISGSRLSVDPIGSVPVRTLDEFCAEMAIAHVDLLKLDTEGHELAVITGAERMLAGRAVSAIQLEFGGANIDARVFLRDIIAALAPEYRVFRLLKDGIEPLTGDEREEIFTYANYVALPA